MPVTNQVPGAYCKLTTDAKQGGHELKWKTHGAVTYNTYISWKLFADRNRKYLSSSMILFWCRLCILCKNSLRISSLFQQIASGVPVLVPSGPARVWKGSGTEPFDLFHLQPLCCLVEGERQVSHSQNTGISPMEHVVAY